MKYLYLFLVTFFSYQYGFSQKNDVFSGELTYEIERVDIKDTIRSLMIIYAKDSLLKIVNFSSNSGKQELIKHLRLNRSFILLETPEQNYAVRTNEHLSIDSSENYTFKRKKGMRKIAGIPVKKLSLKHNKISKALTFYYTESISAKYANVYKNLPGLPLLFYLPTEDGLFKYTLKELKKNSPPLDLFIIPKGYKIVSFEEFTYEFSKSTVEENKN
jgi:hypothetical protein